MLAGGSVAPLAAHEEVGDAELLGEARHDLLRLVGEAVLARFGEVPADRVAVRRPVDDAEDGKDGESQNHRVAAVAELAATDGASDVLEAQTDVEYDEGKSGGQVVARLPGELRRHGRNLRQDGDDDT